jgi:hypothetical protein
MDTSLALSLSLSLIHIDSPENCNHELGRDQPPKNILEPLVTVLFTSVAVVMCHLFKQFETVK